MGGMHFARLRVKQRDAPPRQITGRVSFRITKNKVLVFFFFFGGSN